MISGTDDDVEDVVDVDVLLLDAVVDVLLVETPPGRIGAGRGAKIVCG